MFSEVLSEPLSHCQQLHCNAPMIAGHMTCSKCQPEA
jgi:hypothetical protein